MPGGSDSNNPPLPTGLKEGGFDEVGLGVAAGFGTFDESFYPLGFRVDGLYFFRQVFIFVCCFLYPVFAVIFGEAFGPVALFNAEDLFPVFPPCGLEK